MKRSYTITMTVTTTAPAWIVEVDDEVGDELADEVEGLLDGYEITVADPDSDKEKDLSFTVVNVGVAVVDGGT